MVKMARSPSTTTSATTTAPLSTPLQPSTSARTPSPSTTSGCCSPSWSITLSTELSTFARHRVCSAREYTCDECIQGLEWVEMYLEDPIMIAEFRIYLEQNFCLSDW